MNKQVAIEGEINPKKVVGILKNVATEWLLQNSLIANKSIKLGLPEYDDRTRTYNVPIVSFSNDDYLLGSLTFNTNFELVANTDLNHIRQRAQAVYEKKIVVESKVKKFTPTFVPNKVILGDAINSLELLPPDTAQLIVTSPPYYNARPEYSEYLDYHEYLDFLRKVIIRCHSVLSEGRFFVINISPVLIKRTSRSTASKRIPIPFDLHGVMQSAGFEFIDDIIWAKPEGAGWAAGRGRRFAADRQPLQYKPVVVTEYVLVYRKKTNKLIDWNIRNHHNQDAVKNSKISDGYETTNIWKISPSHNKEHPAVYPEELVNRIIQYYSFKDDLVLDPFAGSGTTGRSALSNGRRFIMLEKNLQYFNYMKKQFVEITKKDKKIRIDYEENFSG